MADPMSRRCAMTLSICRDLCGLYTTIVCLLDDWRWRRSPSPPFTICFRPPSRCLCTRHDLQSPESDDLTFHLSILLKSPGLRLSPWSPPRTVLLSTMAAQGHPAAGLDALLAAVASENGLHHGLGNMAPSLRSLMNHSPQVGRLDMAPEHGWPTRIAIC